MIYRVKSWVSLHVEAPTREAARKHAHDLIDRGHIPIRNGAIDREDIYLISE
jgi:hypothetical protein